MAGSLSGSSTQGQFFLDCLTLKINTLQFLELWRKHTQQQSIVSQEDLNPQFSCRYMRTVVGHTKFNKCSTCIQIHLNNASVCKGKDKIGCEKIHEDRKRLVMKYNLPHLILKIMQVFLTSELKSKRLAHCSHQ